MKWYAIGKTLTPLDRAPESGAAVVLLNSDELAHETALPGLEAVLHHTPSARDAHVCKAEVRSNCLSGTLALPRGRRDGTRLCCGYLVTKDRVVLVDDGEMAEPYLKHIVKEKRLIENSVGRFLYDFFELLIESIYKLYSPGTVSGEAISWTAGAGILVNGATALLLMSRRKNDLNIKGAFLHMAMDTLVSVGVVISGILISLTHYYALDAFIGMGIALIILISTWKLLKESLYLTLDAVPEHIHLDKLEQEISQTQGVESWHHLHVWAVSTTENAATLHVVITSLNEIECTKHALKQLLSQHGITHSTIEFETPGSQCEDTAKGCYHS